MTRRAGKPEAPSHAEDRRKLTKAEKEHLNGLLDEGLKETFPASDTPSVVRPDTSIAAVEPESEDG